MSSIFGPVISLMHPKIIKNSSSTLFWEHLLWYCLKHWINPLRNRTGIRSYCNKFIFLRVSLKEEQYSLLIFNTNFPGRLRIKKKKSSQIQQSHTLNETHAHKKPPHWTQCKNTIHQYIFKDLTFVSYICDINILFFQEKQTDKQKKSHKKPHKHAKN